MSSTPSKRAYLKWENKNGEDDWLQLITPTGERIGWIDPEGILSGSLANGGGGTPGGDPGQLQFNDDGSFGGVLGSVYEDGVLQLNAIADDASAFALSPFSDDQEVPVFLITDAAGTGSNTRATFCISGPGVLDPIIGLNILVSIEAALGDQDPALAMTAKDGTPGAFMTFIQHSNDNAPNDDTSEIVASNGVDDPQQITLNDKTTGVNSIVLAPGPGGGVLVSEDPDGLVGFFGTVPVVRPTIDGVSVDPLAASIADALVAFGLVIDGR